MNIKKIRKQLKKINTLFSAIEEEGQMNAIEQDLMKTYILSLYEQMLPHPQKKEVAKVETAPIKVKKEKTKVEASESIFDEIPETAIIEKEPIESIVEQEYKAIKNGKSSSAAVETVIDLQDDVIEEEVQVEEPATSGDERYDTLFQSDNSNELSSRLSKLPITDLNTAFGLNEKIFNINELFKGDNKVYQETIDRLNQLSTIEEAREYLSSDIVDRYEWLEDHKINKAAQFIKVIQRRYM